MAQEKHNPETSRVKINASRELLGGKIISPNFGQAPCLFLRVGHRGAHFLPRDWGSASVQSWTDYDPLGWSISTTQTLTCQQTLARHVLAQHYIMTIWPRGQGYYSYSPRAVLPRTSSCLEDTSILMKLQFRTRNYWQSYCRPSLAHYIDPLSLSK